MALGAQRRRGHPKRVALAEIDSFFEDYLREPDEDAEDEEGYDDFLDDEPENLRLPYSLELALDLFFAYRNHGILERSGGYLDQSRAWRRTMHFLSARELKTKRKMAAQKKDVEEVVRDER